MMLTADIRNSFLNFFKKNGHEILPSAPLIPHNDPSLLFTNAGMVPFKNYFTGKETPPFSRVTTAQRCVRAGGKHNDLENVGYTARHHTFFEMLGNFSFGDYFKEEAIVYAWTLLTKEFGLQPEKLWITVYHEDVEAAKIWKKITGFPDHKIISISTTDNFWSMGDTGPCGPCTEIFYDHGERLQGGLPGSDNEGDRFVEIWNLVFMQFDRQQDGQLVPLPKPCVDTGMGIERMACVVQGVTNNYDTDIFKALIQKISAEVVSDFGKDIVSKRVIADHVRAVSFLIADGVLPLNEGRGYVLRRIIRRAVRHVHLLGCGENPLLYKLVSTLIAQMGQAYPELERAKPLIVGTLEEEEKRFNETLTRGLKVLEDEIGGTGLQGEKLSGEAAFKLYDTFGFPLDLTQDILRNRGLYVDVHGFDAVMQEQKEKSRAAWSGSGEALSEEVWFNLAEEFGETKFLGYEQTIFDSEILGIVREGKRVDKVQAGETAFLLTRETPFYAESGGQMGDAGAIESDSGFGCVLNTMKRAGKLHVHEVQLERGVLAVFDKVKLKIDQSRRQALKANHSATHLLHAALRQYLGQGVTQKGSLVAPDRLRFDFSYGKPVTQEILDQVEDQVNATIRQNQRVETQIMSPEKALNQGALGLFGEKYGHIVRVVSVGEGDETSSQELCGGTHVRRTGEIGLFKIISESGVSAGIRRIEATTGAIALAFVREKEKLVSQMARLLKVPGEGVFVKVENLLATCKRLEKKKETFKGECDNQVVEKHPISQGELWVVDVALSAKQLKPMMDELRQRISSGVILIFSTYEEKCTVLLGVKQAKEGVLDARILLKELSTLFGTQGGGRQDLAQCGGEVAKKELAVQRLLAQLQ